ncbi:MAG: hypothetical protein M1822_002853 [Bathelium mastoideum]|nr:MAG: hypothetical protein M1822_002853 [Bathelium mastoideum]
MSPFVHLFLQILLYLGAFTGHGFSAPPPSTVSVPEVDTALAKRAFPAQIQRAHFTQMGGQYHISFRAVYPLTNEDADMDPALLRHYATEAYRELSPEFANGNVLLSILFVPKTALIIETNPHDTAVASSIIARGRARVLRWGAIMEARIQANPTFTPTDLTECEDAVVVMGGELYAIKMGLKPKNGPVLPANTKLPRKSKLMAYGKYRATDTAGPKPPCQAWCIPMLERMGVTWYDD